MTVLDVFAIKPLKKCCQSHSNLLLKMFRTNIEVRQAKSTSQKIIPPKRTSATFPVVMIVLNKNCGPLRFFSRTDFSSIGYLAGFQNVFGLPTFRRGFFSVDGEEIFETLGKAPETNNSRVSPRFPQSISPFQPEKALF